MAEYLVNGKLKGTWRFAIVDRTKVKQRNKIFLKK